MNITEFAERVVFGTTLEDKLFDPGTLTDEVDDRRRGPSVISLATPGRPSGLHMHHGHNGAKPPSDAKLENEPARGQLLHFLANHELLATELMALVLLKFPDAPDAFRRGIVATLKEEQEHTRLYLRRMKECGVEFGSFPLSGQFWRLIEPMRSPMEFVSRLSLTFEQANLDYCLHFASVFRNLDDTDTADILERIYQDEIGHVSHGLHWFRKWKNPEQSDWEAYRESLTFPMSPQRAIGPRGTFNRDGRKQAGLTDDFIDAIEVFRQSRGRTPTVNWFDPAAEAELANELSPKMAALMGQLGKDLELVMVAMTKQDDVMLVRRMPSLAFRKQLIDVGFDSPEFMLFEDRSTLGIRKLHDFSPWAWTPRNCEIAQSLSASAFVPPVAWQSRSGDLFRKSWGADRLKEWLKESDRSGELPAWLTGHACAGIPVYNENDAVQAIEELADRGYANAIVKQDLATAGRGQRSIACNNRLGEHDIAWLKSMLGSNSDSNSRSASRQPAGVVEPELDRLLDLSFLWKLPRDSETPQYLGWTRPRVTAGRRFAGTRFGTVLSDCDQRLKQFIFADRCSRLQTVVDWLEARLVPELMSRNFSGYFGVDALVCHDKNGELKIKPLVELNPRMTMGHVALRLGKRLAPGTEAEFRIFTRPEWDEMHEELEQIPFVKTSNGRWKSGVIWLGEVDDATKLIPAMLVGKRLIES